MNAYYNVSTVFYEWAWGSSFHFAPRKPYETFQGAILRHELRLADRLRIKEGHKVLDVGCGIGGPLFNIAKNTGVSLFIVRMGLFEMIIVTSLHSVVFSLP